jgi:molecular chaperone GrpE (heat shock protein)
MQWQMEKDVLTQTKHDIEEKYESISQKYNYQQRDLDQYKKLPTSKIKEATKFAIKDFLKTTTNNLNNPLTPVLQKNIINKTSNHLSLDRFKKVKDELNVSFISN